LSPENPTLGALQLPLTPIVVPESSSAPRSPQFTSLEQRVPAMAELARAARFAVTLQHVASALASTLERDPLLETLVQTTIESLGAVAGGVAELSADGRQLTVVAAVGYPQSLLDHLGHLALDDHPAAAELLRTRKPIFLASQAEFAAAAPRLAGLTQAAGARVALPLATPDQLLGILLITFAEPRTFAPDEREFLSALSHQCAVAMERVALFSREREARHAAEAANARLGDSLERMSDLYFVCDDDWRYERVNRAMRDFLRQTGFDAEQLLGRVIWEVFPRLVGGPLHAAMYQARASQQSVSFSARGTYADSWYEGHAFPMGRGVGVHVHDTTVRHRAEEEVHRLSTALERRVDEMETLLKVIPVGIGIANDPQGNDITVNPAMATLLRVPTTVNASKTGPDGDSLPFRVLRDGVEMAADELPLQRAARTGVSLPYSEYEIQFGDRTRITLLASAAPILDGEGRVRGSVGAFVDITARKRAELASRLLAEASAAFATSLDIDRTFAVLAQRVVPDMADICVIFVTREGGSVGVNAMETTDASLVEQLRRFDREHPVDATPTHPVWHAIRDGRSILVPSVSDASIASMLSGEQSVIALARETETTSLLMVPIATRGHVLGALGLGTRGMRRPFDQGDLLLAEELGRRTAMALDNAYLLAAEHRARAEAELARSEAERASRAKSDFLAMMSHELRTPLNAIAGYAELIELGVRGPVSDAQVIDLQKIRQNQRHLLGLINSVLNFARLDAGRVLYDLANVPLAAALRAVESLIEPQLRERALVYHLAPCDVAVTARADSEKLQQILLNLLGNAAKFTAGGGRIELSCRAEDRQVHIIVRDTGVGIPPEQFDRIFEPFVQGSRGSRSTKEGVGLGLAISRELARGMGGELTVESEVGVGSTFTLTLPRGPDRTSRP
jgi:signal transduction histidine kinase/PAS domain-containing protein